jgi:hypothetical protein
MRKKHYKNQEKENNANKIIDKILLELEKIAKSINKKTDRTEYKQAIRSLKKDLKKERKYNTNEANSEYKAPNISYNKGYRSDHIEFKEKPTGRKSDYVKYQPRPKQKEHKTDHTINSELIESLKNSLKFLQSKHDKKHNHENNNDLETLFNDVYKSIKQAQKTLKPSKKHKKQPSKSHRERLRDSKEVKETRTSMGR